MVTSQHAACFGREAGGDREGENVFSGKRLHRAYFGDEKGDIELQQVPVPPTPNKSAYRL